MHPRAEEFAARARDRYGFDPQVTEFPEGTRTAADAAAAIGCEVGAIASSLAFRLDGDRREVDQEDGHDATDATDADDADDATDADDRDRAKAADDADGAGGDGSPDGDGAAPEDRLVVAVTSGANRVDEARLAARFGAAAATTADPDAVAGALGWSIGGVPPFCHDRTVPVVLDADLLAYDEVWAAAGTPEAVFPIDPERLRSLAGAEPIEWG